MTDIEFARKSVVVACVAACLAMAPGVTVEAAQAKTKAVAQKQSTAIARVQLADGRWLEGCWSSC